MALQGSKRVEENDWESHRDELERLYATEDRSLQEVMSVMRERHGWTVKKNQYETYLTKKWGLHKNVDSSKWRAVDAYMRANGLTEKGCEVLIDGKKQSPTKVRKERSRYKPENRLQLSTGAPQALPKGVIVRTCPAKTQFTLFAKLPFQGLEGHLYDKLPITSQSYSVDVPSPVTGTNSGGTDLWRPNPELEADLRAVVPQPWPFGTSFDFALMTPQTSVFASPLHRAIICAIANNFAGMESTSKTKILDFLFRETSGNLLHSIQSSPCLYTTQAVAQNVFDAAVELGNISIINFLLHQPRLRVQLNRIIRTRDGFFHTPLEKAASLGYQDVVVAMLDAGADVLLAAPSHGLDRTHGVLNCLLASITMDCIGRRGRVGMVESDLVTRLLDADADLDSEILYRLIRINDSDLLLLRLLTKYVATYYSRWSSAGIFVSIFQYKGRHISLKVLTLMLRAGISLNHAAPKTEHHSQPLTIIDAATKRGDLCLVKHLLDVGANLTDDTLAFAVMSRNQEVISYAFECYAEADKSYVRGLSPLAAAIRTKDDATVQVFLSSNDVMASEQKKGLRDVLRAAAEVSNFELMNRLLQSEGSRHTSKQLGVLLAVVIDALYRCGNERKQQHSEVALALIEAGADTNTTSTYSCCPLYNAVSHGDAALVSALVIAEADPNWHYWSKTSFLPFSPAIVLAVQSGNQSILQHIIAAGADVNAIQGCEDANAASALGAAVWERDKELISFLIDAGCDVNNHSLRNTQETILCAAVATRDLDITEYILRCGADPHDDAALCEAYSPLQSNDTITHLLLKRHEHRYPTGRPWGAEVLLGAIQEEDYDSFQLMLSSSGSPNTIPRWNLALGGDEFQSMTPFGYAIAISKNIGPKFVELLLEHKKGYCCPESIASGNAFDDNMKKQPIPRETAFLIAIASGYRPVVDLLMRYKADVNYAAQLGIKRTPLQKAAELGNMELVLLLLDRGADVNGAPARSGGGTALQLAAIQGFLQIAQY